MSEQGGQPGSWGDVPPPEGTPPPPPQGGQPGWGAQPPPPQGGQPQAPQGGQPGWGAKPPPPQGGQPSWGAQPPPPQGGQPQAPQGGQPGWGAQGHWGPGGPPSASSGQIEPRIAGILAYVPFGWIGGLVVYLVNKDPLSRFQGAQSVLLGIAMMGLFFSVGILTALSRGFYLFGLLLPLVWLASVGLSIYLAVQGYNLRKVTLPVIGPIAEQWALKQ